MGFSLYIFVFIPAKQRNIIYIHFKKEMLWMQRSIIFIQKGYFIAIGCRPLNYSVQVQWWMFAEQKGLKVWLWLETGNWSPRSLLLEHYSCNTSLQLWEIKVVTQMVFGQADGKSHFYIPSSTLLRSQFIFRRGFLCLTSPQSAKHFLHSKQMIVSNFLWFNKKCLSIVFLGYISKVHQDSQEKDDGIGSRTYLFLSIML